MQFRSFRLSGFKSFVEPAEVEISAGLTGIVGPNGCGKSNLVEGLRWVMGETSARRLRGGEMDDVIFGGAAGRPARNIAEVSLVIDNTGRSAPAVFNAFDEIEVRRRIERGAGSDYRVNGKNVRARDVQLLFADAAIGADSPALVSQGRVAALISAKPTERRYILEDAAGIGGMQSRRHEAELKLQAASTNLQQLDVVLETLLSQGASLKRQVRQAEKYRELGEQIRAAEALLLYVIWRDAAARQAQAEDDFTQADRAVAEALAHESVAALRESEAELALPALRMAREQAHGALRELTQQQAALSAEQRQHERDLQAALADQAQAVQDREAEQAACTGAIASLQRLQTEASELEQGGAATHEALAKARKSLEARLAAVAEAEAIALQQAAELAKDQALTASLARQEGELRTRAVQLQTNTTRLEAELATLGAPHPAHLAETGQDIKAARQLVAKLEAEIERARQEHSRKRELETATRQTLNQAEASLLRHQAELAGLQRSLAAGGTPQDFSPVLEQISVTPGYEAALAVALGSDLDAALVAEAPHRWEDLAGVGTEAVTDSLAHYVKAPPALQRALHAVRIVEAADALARQATLLPGQMLVTKGGALYRWDGLVRETVGASPEAVRLAQRNELDQLAGQLPALEAAHRDAAIEAEGARQAVQSATATERGLAGELEAATRALRLAEQSLATAEAAAREAETKRLRLQDALQAARAQEAETATQRQRLVAEQQQLPDIATAEAALAIARQQLQAVREAEDQAARTLRQAELVAETRAARLVSLAREQQSWQDIIDRNEQQLQAIAGRQNMAAAKEAAARARLPAIATALATLLDQLVLAERQERETDDRLVVAEQEMATLRQATRAAQSALSTAREKRGGAEARLIAAQDSVTEAAHQLHERCHLTPEAVTLSLLPEEEAADRSSAEASLARLLRERENLGAVNLRAETELAEITSEVQRIEMEKTDLLLAIERLRQAITTLNREARERLLAAFETVQVQFRRLFTTLFGGGEAELTLTGLDDPLTAGLEIYASPPGKKLQLLSLLSGGEQALTALALLFAMFLATPAPVCVLDEVDAPLDDANVTRFCDLLSEIATTTGTRFLVITHHRVTMARMDRLYGVTMAERGVSMLVSVDLKTAATVALS